MRVLVLNCGSSSVKYQLVETSRAEWDRMLAVNLTGVYLTCTVFARQLLRQGHGGRISAGNRPGGGACFTVQLPARAHGGDS